MEDSHYFLKSIGLDYEKNFCDSLARDEMDNLDYLQLSYGNNESGSKEGNRIKEPETDKDDICDKQEQTINDEVSQIMSKVEADDFFSSLELQSSSKTSSGVLGLSFQNKPMSGIVTRSRSLLSTSHDTSKLTEMKTKLKMKVKKRTKVDKGYVKRRKKNDKARKDVRKTAVKSTGRKVRMSSGSGEALRQQQHLDKLDENALSVKCKDDDDWLFFQQLEMKKEMSEDKLFENKQLLGNDLNHVTRQGTSELFSMSPISIGDVMSEDKDEVDKLLEGEYDETFLEEMDEFSHAPPRSHTGGKWKPGSLPVRSSPMLWQSQNWENFLEDRSNEEGSKARSDTPIESPTDLRAFTGGKWKSLAPPATHTGGKWKPITPPATHTGGKWKPLTPPASHTGGKWKPVTPPATYSAGKWKPPDVNQKLKKSESKMTSDDDGEGVANQMGGKWKPSSSLSLSKSHCRDIASTSVHKPDKIPSENMHGKWSSGFVKTSFTRSTLDIVASCQSTSGKCLKTSGGVIQYFCSPCNRRLSSKKMYKKHVQSELHLKRVLQENDLEFDSRSLKMYRGFMAQSARNERATGKRVIKKPEMYNETPMTKTHKKKSEIKGKCKKFSRKEIIRCEVCKIKIPSYQLGKHLVSYYHTRRSQVQDPNQRTLILNNIHAIVKQAPYQCGICKFYCNNHVTFKRHWALPVHLDVEKSHTDHRFWCALCNFETATARSMELHLDSNSHREVIQAVNKSIPIIIRHKKIFRCEICFKEYRFNREILHHKQTYHPGTVMDTGDKFTCKLCDRRCKTMKSLQKHIIQFHKNETNVPYFCSICSEFFSSMEEAKEHRNGQVHKFNRKLSEKGISPEKGLSWSCSYCRESFDDLAKLKVHLFEKHQSLLPKCMKCGKVFALSQEVSRHVKKNECVFTSPPESAGFRCEICPFATDIQSEFLVHAAIHQKKDKADRKIDCPLCGSSFTQAALSIHLRTHLNEKTYRCSMCSSTFVRKYRYVAHLKSKHFSKEEESKTSTEITEVNAKAQTREVGEREKIIDERRQAEEKRIDDNKKVLQKETSVPKRQTCGDSKCKYVAKDEKDLENHSLIHVGPKVYQCPECPYYAKTNTVIKRHFMIHMGEKQFSCPHCSFKGRLKSHLKRHLRLHTGAKPYKCPHCPYMCNILENLRKHVLHTKIHPGKKLYECKMCKFDTNGSKEFKVHLMESHQKDCRVADAIVASGVYNREDDVASSNNPIVDSSKSASRNTEPKPLSKQMKKKIETLTEKFAPIAPKPGSSGKSEDSCLKNTKNLVEDKRKVLEMELEKLKQQIKPDVKKIPRSYPSPAEKGFKLKRVTEEEPEKEVEIGKKPRPEFEEMELAQDVGDMMLVLPSITSSADEIPPTKFLPSTYILCDNEIEQEETEFYLLEDYDV